MADSNSIRTRNGLRTNRFQREGRDDSNPYDMQLLSALGIGALVGVIVQQLALLYHAHNQHQHELELKRIDIEEHQRDQRLHRLREDLKELMSALFEIERALNLFHGGHARAAGEVQSPEALQVIERLTERRETARAGLLLDPDGQKLYDVFHAVLDKVNDAQAKARYTQTVAEERGSGPELSLRLAKQQPLLRRGGGGHEKVTPGARSSPTRGPDCIMSL